MDMLSSGNFDMILSSHFLPIYAAVLQTDRLYCSCIFFMNITGNIPILPAKGRDTKEFIRFSTIASNCVPNLAYAQNNSTATASFAFQHIPSAPCFWATGGGDDEAVRFKKYVKTYHGRSVFVQFRQRVFVYSTHAEKLYHRHYCLEL